jgi:hypothetical protein
LLEALKSTSVNTIVYKRGADIKGKNGNVISVSKCSYVERSTHPIFTVTVSSETKSFVYSTSAFLEANVLEYADVMILGSHGATVKPLKRTAFSSAIASSIPSAILFTSPYEMLGDDDIISYVHYLYQNGHTIIIDGKEFYKFSLN